LDIKSVVSNPYVIGGGVLLGVVILAISHGSSGGSNGAISSPGDALNSYQAQSAAMGMQYAYQNAQLAAQSSADMSNINLQRDLGYLKTLENLTSIDANHDTQRMQINSDITKTRIQAQTAASVEADNNFTRLMTSYIASNDSRYAIDSNERSNNMSIFSQMATQEAAQTQQAATAGLSSVLNFVPKLFGK